MHMEDLHNGNYKALMEAIEEDEQKGKTFHSRGFVTLSVIP